MVILLNRISKMDFFADSGWRQNFRLAQRGDATLKCLRLQAARATLEALYQAHEALRQKQPQRASGSPSRKKRGKPLNYG